MPMMLYSLNLTFCSSLSIYLNILMHCNRCLVSKLFSYTHLEMFWDAGKSLCPTVQMFDFIMKKY